jgi:S1-C subfamily serine protease
MEVDGGLLERQGKIVELGSGAIVSADGKILTAAHVVEKWAPETFTLLVGMPVGSSGKVYMPLSALLLPDSHSSSLIHIPPLPSRRDGRTLRRS